MQIKLIVVVVYNKFQNVVTNTMLMTEVILELLPLD